MSIELIALKGTKIHKSSLEEFFADWEEQRPSKFVEVIRITSMFHGFNYRQEVQDALSKAKKDGLIIGWVAEFDGKKHIG